MDDHEAYSVEVIDGKIKLKASKGASVTLTPDEAERAIRASDWDTTIVFGNGYKAEKDTTAGWDFDTKILTESGSHVVSVEKEYLEQAIDAAEMSKQARLIQRLEQLQGVSKAVAGSLSGIAVYSSETHNRDVTALMAANDYVILDCSGMSDEHEDDHYMYFVPRGNEDMEREKRSRDL